MVSSKDTPIVQSSMLVFIPTDLRYRRAKRHPYRQLSPNLQLQRYHLLAPTSGWGSVRFQRRQGFSPSICTTILFRMPTLDSPTGADMLFVEAIRSKKIKKVSRGLGPPGVRAGGGTNVSAPLNRRESSFLFLRLFLLPLTTLHTELFILTGEARVSRPASLVARSCTFALEPPHSILLRGIRS